MPTPTEEQAAFWNWFRSRADRLRHALLGEDDSARQAASDDIHEALARALPDAAFTVGGSESGEDGEFIISPDGKRERFDDVKEFVAAAPEIPGWQVVAFRPRMAVGSSLVLRLQDIEVSADDIWFTPHDADDGLGVTLYIRDLEDAHRQLRETAALLLLDHAIGEEDSMIVLRSLSAESLPADPEAEGLRPLGELPEFLDEYKQEAFPPPGGLPLDDDGDWTTLRGNINEKPALVLVNMQLRSLQGHPAYDHCLTISVPYTGNPETGLPASTEELDYLQQLGDRFTEALQRGQQSVLAVVLLNDNHRELIFYTSAPAAAAARAEQIRREHPDRVINVQVSRDSFWESYASFTHACDESEEESEE